MATKVYRSGGVIVVEQNSKKHFIPSFIFDWDFPVPTSVTFFDTAQGTQYSDAVANIQDENGAAIGNADAITSYLTAIVGSVGGDSQCPVYRYFNFQDGGYPDEFDGNFEFQYNDGTTVQTLSVDLTGVQHNTLADFLAAINAAQSIYVFEVAPIEKLLTFPQPTSEAFGITAGTQPVENFVNGSLVWNTINGAIVDSSYTESYLPESAVQAVEKYTKELAGGNTLIPSIQSVTNAASLNAGAKWYRIENIGAAAGLVGGVSIPVGKFIEVPVIRDGADTYPALAFDATGTTFLIQAVY